MKFNYLWFKELSYTQLKFVWLCINLLLASFFFLMLKLVRYGFNIGFVPMNKLTDFLSFTAIIIIQMIVMTIVLISWYKIKCKKCGAAILLNSHGFHLFKKPCCSDCKADFNE